MPSLNNKEVFPSLSLESDNERCQSFRLGMGVPVPQGPGNMIICGIKAPHQHPGAHSSLNASAALNPSSARTLNQCAVNAMAVAYINHKGGIRSHAALKEASQIITWMETNGPAISEDHIPGVENWKADYLSHHCLDQKEWGLHPDIFILICQKWGTLDVDILASVLSLRANSALSAKRIEQEREVMILIALNWLR